MTSRTAQRRALLLGCGTYTDGSLAELRSPRRDVEQLARVLRDPGTCRYAVTTRTDCTSQDARREIEAFFAAARITDTMNLLYLSCHGVQDRRGRLYFAFTDTERTLLSSTAVSAEWVRDCMYASRSRATLVLVDCCFSGGFIKGMQARSGGSNVESLVQDIPQGSGVAVLTASGDTEVSFEDAESATIRPSYFTGALLAGISTGAADRNHDGLITADELYDYIYDEVVSGPSPQRPRRLGAGEGVLVVADASGGAGPALTSPEPRAVSVPLTAKGVLGRVSFDGQWLVIAKNGVGHIYKGERRYHVSQLAGVAVKAATRLNYGYFQALLPGVEPAPVARFGPHAGRPPMTDDDSISFARSANDTVLRIRDVLQAAIDTAHGRAVPQPPADRPAGSPSAGGTVRTNPEADHQRGVRDGSRVTARLPLAALDGLVFCEFDVARWISPWKQQRHAGPGRPAPAWLAEVAEHLGVLAAADAAFTPTHAYLTGFGAGARQAWTEAVAAHLLPPDRVALVNWMAQPADWLRPGAHVADATMDDLAACRRGSRRSAVARTAARIALWVLTAVFLILEIAAIGVTIDGGWTKEDGTVSENQTADAILANLGCSIPLAVLITVGVLDLRRTRRRKRQ